MQDSITAGNFLFNVGFRADWYDGITSNSGAEPRAGIAYHVKKTGTVLRVAYARTFETPFNENLLLSSATGAGGLDQNVFGANAAPIQPGTAQPVQWRTCSRRSADTSLVDADYFWKYTHSAYDFSTLLNTTITFPISWHNSKLDGVTGRVSTTNLHGFQAYWTFGHTRARYFFPEVGGLISQGTPLNGSVFRIDHDQAFQSTGVFRYQHKNCGMGDADVAVRQRTGGQRHSRFGRGAGADGGAADLDRPGVRRRVRRRCRSRSRVATGWSRRS